MKPIPETIEVAHELDRYLGDGGVLTHLESIGDDVRGIAPDCIGLSLAWNDQGITFTLVATDEEIAGLDAVQYLDGGPCVTAIDRDEGIETTAPELMSEDPWRLFAASTAAFGVRSTLTLPITERGQVVGSVNLYGGTDHTFEGHHEELARILGAWAPGAVRNSDLSFATRKHAERAPEQFRDDSAVDMAVGVVAAHQQTDVTIAQQRLEDAASRAGITPAQLARALVDLRDSRFSG